MRLLAIVGIATWILCGSIASASPEGKKRADKLFDDGRKYLLAKEYALACTAFEQSQEADPAIGTQLNIALCYEAWGKLGSAYRAYVEAERLASAKGDSRAKGAHQKVAELTANAPYLRIEIPPDLDPSTVFLFDAKEIERAKLADEMLVDAGSHAIEARVPGQPPKTLTVDVQNGEHRKVVVDVPKPVVTPVVVVAPPPPPPPPPRRAGRFYGGIALTAGGVIAIAVASVVALGARTDYDNAIANCPAATCLSRSDFDATQHARTRANQMTFVGVGGLALAGAGLYLIFTSRGHVEAPQKTALVPLLAPDLVGLAIGGRL